MPDSYNLLNFNKLGASYRKLTILHFSKILLVLQREKLKN